MPKTQFTCKAPTSFLKRPGVQVRPLKKQDQFTEYVECVDDKIELNNPIELPTSTNRIEDPEKASDKHLESIFTKDIKDVAGTSIGINEH